MKTGLLIFMIVFTSYCRAGSLTYLANESKCVSSFQCDSGCCSNGSCKDKDDCDSLIRRVYVICGVMSLIILGITTLYLFLQIRETKKNVVLIKEKINAKLKSNE